MKKSRYNIFIKYDDKKYIIFNPLYGTIGKLENDIVKRYINDKLTDEETEILYKKDIFIDDDIDEIEVINKGRIAGITDTHTKVYRIWTTSSCNARCFYCFECGMKHETMTTKTASDVAKYILDNINKEDRIRIEWFGGEPLLNTNAMLIISGLVIDKCNTVGAKYYSNIITNGSLVNKKVIDIFKDCKVRRCQITLDGLNEDYDKAKNYYNKKFNFNSVINNIDTLLKNEINVSIRLNYLNTNYESLSKLIDYLHNRFTDNKCLRVYIYPVWSATNDTFVSEAHADINYIKLIDKLVRYKFINAEDVIGLKRKVRQCAARNINSVAILPNGNFSKCSEVFNQVIGNIYDGITDVETYYEWTKEILSDRCNDCVYLPICNDGCKASRYNNMPTCFPTKEIFDDIIRWYVNYLDENNDCIKH